MRADLHVAVERDARVIRCYTSPAERTACDLGNGEGLLRADHHGVGFWPDLQHEARFSVVGWKADIDAFALADSEGESPFVGADLITRPVEDRTLLCANPVGEPTAGVTIRNEADVVGIGLIGDAETALGRLSTHLGLARGCPEREHAVRELLRGQHAEHVGLILRPGRSAVELAVAILVGTNGRIVAGRDGIETERERLLEQGGKLDPFVAAHARVRRAASGILGDEIVDDVKFEAFGEVPDVVGDADDVGCPLRVHRVLDGATAAGARPQRAGLSAEREVHSDNVVAGVDRARRGDRRVDSAAHRRQNSHAIQCRRAP